jgi:protein-ribulosamine 3-kinase
MAQSGWGDTGEPMAALEEVEQDDSWLKCPSASSSLVRALFTNAATGLPKDSSVMSTKGGAASYWSQAARIHVRLSGGKERTYFLRLTRGSIGKLMVEGEFESMKALHAVAPHMVPEPIGHGTFSTNSDTHFILIEFLHLHDGLPSEEDFCRQLAELHRKSMEHSPNGKFGFHLTTCNGTVQQDSTWTNSWETFYTRLLKQAFTFDEEAPGPCSEYSELLPLIYDKVCPRLLRPPETEGRTIRPALIHGDLWDGNVALQAHTEQPYIFDSSAFYAHNEYDLHMWRGEKIQNPRLLYHRVFQASSSVRACRGVGRSKSIVIFAGGLV